jgi:hypothetical protein
LCPENWAQFLENLNSSRGTEDIEMSDLWFWGNEDMWSTGEDSPDPVIQGDTTWTWDVEFITNSTQTTYARASVNSLSALGSGYMFSGIVSYRTRNADGTDTPHPVGQTEPSGFFNNGVTDVISDVAVDDVLFGWGVGASGGSVFTANINMEIWVSG